MTRRELARTSPAWLVHRPSLLTVAVIALAASARPLSAARNGPRADSLEIHHEAVEAQGRFESERFSRLPVSSVTAADACAEKSGGLCFRWGDDSPWSSRPEAPEVDSLRHLLIRQLDSLQNELPGDAWILGQRVWYRGQSGDWAEALATARASAGAEAWWRAALEGLALHQEGRYPEAEEAFRTALAGMPRHQAARWRMPRWVVSGDLAGLLEDADPVRRDTLLARLWQLADPLYLVPGNDRETAHYARWTVATLERGAANPHRKLWSAGMEELVLRHGWETSWTRLRRQHEETGTDEVIGYNKPEGREYMPPASAVEQPSSATFRDLIAGGWRPRTIYTPPYAPVLLPMDGQLAVFPRGDSVVVIATAFVPGDTTLNAREGRSRPWMDADGAAGFPDARGLFLMHPDGGEAAQSIRQGDGPAGFLLRAPAGRYVVSAESWSPPRHIAGRRRQGLRADTLPPDLATLSGLLLVDPSMPEPTSLEAAAEGALPRAQVPVGSDVRLLWELGGLGRTAETVAYRISVDRAHESVFRSLGRLLHLVGSNESVSMAWSEPWPPRSSGPPRPMPRMTLRSVRLNLNELDAGAYRVRVQVRIAGRTSMSSETTLRIGPG